jgi:NAD(P)-dependent dehydrogenase (short-subunit alcohol dehydrogenase family)
MFSGWRITSRITRFSGRGKGQGSFIVGNSTKRVALVTGGARGIGRGIADALAAAGFNLAVNGVRDSERAAEAISALERLGAEVLYCRGDVSSADDRKAVVDAVRERFGRLDVLVNNAGVAPYSRTDLLDATEESFVRLMRINLKAPYFLTQLVARWMISQRQADPNFNGVVVNISSVSATEASVNRGDYCISKAGLAMATQLWAARLAEYGIGVYEVRPGVVRTDMTEGVAEKYDRLIANGLTVERRWGTPEDVGRAVAILARGELSYATGNVIRVDGGLTLRRL